MTRPGRSRGDSETRRPLRHVRRRPDAGIDPGRWPATVPAVAQILRDGLAVPGGLTVLVGENGCGKSTVVEMIAEAYGLNPQGGSAIAQFRTRDSEPGIGRQLIADRGPDRPRWSYFLRADTMHGLYSYLEDSPGRVQERFHELSHGEGFLAVLRSRGERARFLPDGRAGRASVLHRLPQPGVTQYDLAVTGSQAIVATHSPMVAAVPGATILELGGHPPVRVGGPRSRRVVAPVPDRAGLLLPVPDRRRALTQTSIRQPYTMAATVPASHTRNHSTSGRPVSSRRIPASLAPTLRPRTLRTPDHSSSQARP